MSKLYFRYGAMNSGKSTNLMQVAYNYEERGMKVKIFKPQVDTKGGNRLVSRLGVVREADFSVRTHDDLYEVTEKWIQNEGKIHCVLVDEVQFLKAEQIDQLLKVAIVLKVPVICYGLRTDFLMNGFEGSARLLLLAHSIEELKTICTCGKKALLNGRKLNGEFIFEGAQVAIDLEGDVEYQSLCADCYFKYRKKAEEKKKNL
ncbi:thymidine kinase [Proteiniclasticum ruminis]|uniref:Thymidine kinase n=1 Tax=Proteiniclasticum ruminis TaxID=398199 RepID=A0A1G8GUG8_9CLOT|nr:thymidine kinase [Proteiniclasticum ruminis]MBP9920627.1 thymidine kinase [Proteiniclasticum sp.]SDH98037.1 thymidine kinase [Proteiniclasticum ruminis]